MTRRWILKFAHWSFVLLTLRLRFVITRKRIEGRLTRFRSLTKINLEYFSDQV